MCSSTWFRGPTLRVVKPMQNRSPCKCSPSIADSTPARSSWSRLAGPTSKWEAEAGSQKADPTPARTTRWRCIAAWSLLSRWEQDTSGEHTKFGTQKESKKSDAKTAPTVRFKRSLLFLWQFLLKPVHTTSQAASDQMQILRVSMPGYINTPHLDSSSKED